MTENATRQTLNLSGGQLELGPLGTRRLDYDILGKALGNMCVLRGQTERFFSLAELALTSIPLVPESDMLHALLYPTPATVIGDIAPEAQAWFGGHVLAHFQEEIRAAIYKHLELPPPERIVSERVRHAQAKTLAEVQNQLLGSTSSTSKVDLLYLPPDKAAKTWVRATELMLGEQLGNRLSRYYRIMSADAGNASEY